MKQQNYLSSSLKLVQLQILFRRRKRKSSARLKQRRESRLRGTKPPTNKPVKRGRSTTTQIFLENQAGASILNTRVESDRKVSANRLANRLKRSESSVLKVVGMSRMKAIWSSF